MQTSAESSLDDPKLQRAVHDTVHILTYAHAAVIQPAESPTAAMLQATEIHILTAVIQPVEPSCAASIQVAEVHTPVAVVQSIDHAATNN